MTISVTSDGKNNAPLGLCHPEVIPSTLKRIVEMKGIKHAWKVSVVGKFNFIGYMVKHRVAGHEVKLSKASVLELK